MEGCIKKRNLRKYLSYRGFFCDPRGARTLDPQIKSLLLYQLSYGVIVNGLQR